MIAEPQIAPAESQEFHSAVYQHGWYKIAFERDLTADLTPVTIGPKRLVIVRSEDGIRVIDADCPHRGAHLGHGGKLDRNAVICPFHCYRIGIGRGSLGDFQVREYETLVVGGVIFMRLSDSHECGFRNFITTLAEDHTINPGFTMEINCPPELIIENGFDNSHFRPVHGVEADKFIPVMDKNGSIVVHGMFHAYVGPQRVRHEVPLHLIGFSPYLSVAQLGGSRPMVFMTSVNPIGENKTLLRFSLALNKYRYGDPVPPDMLSQMLAGNRSGIGDDVVIWEHISMTSPRNYTSLDYGILQFQKFCQQFV